jgi:small subunit ribosomal protein MRP21
MELRRAAEVILRSQTSSLSFLAPSTARWQRGRQICHQFSNRPSQRAFTSSSPSQALKPPVTSATPPEEPQTDAQPSWARGGSNSRRQGFNSPSMDPEIEKRLNGGDTASDLLSRLSKSRPSIRATSNSSFDVGRMLDPYTKSGGSSSPSSTQDMMEQIGMTTMPKQESKIPMRLNPAMGRGIPIGPGVDVGRGFKMLEQLCGRNKVKSDAMKQRFHERGGLKRKRLARERWRKRFKAGFIAAVLRVKQLRSQGW